MNASTRYLSSREECIIFGTYSQRHLRLASQTENTRPVLAASGDTSAPARNTGHRTRLAISTRFPGLPPSISAHWQGFSTAAGRRSATQCEVGTYVCASILSSIQTRWSLAEATSAPGLPHSWDNWKLDPYPDSTHCIRIMMQIINSPHNR